MIDGDYEALEQRSLGRLKQLQTSYFGSENAPPESDVEGTRIRVEKNAKLDSFRTFVQGLVPVRNDSRQSELTEFKSPRETGTKNSMGPRDLLVQADRYVYASYDDIGHVMSTGGVTIADASIRGHAEIVMQDAARVAFRAESRGGNPYIRSYMDNMFDYETGQEILATYLASVFDTPEQARIFLSYNSDSRTSEEWDTALTGEIKVGTRIIISEKRAKEITAKIKEIYATMGFEPPLSLEVRIPDSAIIDRSRLTGEQQRTKAKIMALPDTDAGYAKREDYAADVAGIKKLNDAQKKAIRDAHDVRMAGDKYSPAELRQKMEILEAGGFTREQADLLLRMGVCGSMSSTADVDYLLSNADDTDLENAAAMSTNTEWSSTPIDPGFAFGPDLEQANVGNCYLVAAFNGMYHHPRFDDMMTASIRQRSDGCFEVSFPLGSDSPTQTVVVTREDIGTQRTDDEREELRPVTGFYGWPVLEAAFLKKKTGGTDRTKMEGGYGHEALVEMFGDTVEPEGGILAGGIAGARDKGDIPADMTDEYAREQIGAGATDFFDSFDPEHTIATINTSTTPSGKDTETFTVTDANGDEITLFKNHAYSIESVDRAAKTVVVKNPHDTSAAITLTYNQAIDAFSDISAVRFKQPKKVAAR